jgi:hypothetical protein
MNRLPTSSPCLAALRPWPFGPPLRGRAPHGEAGGSATHREAGVAARPAPSGPRAGGQATAPVGGLAWSHLIYSA